MPLVVPGLVPASNNNKNNNNATDSQAQWTSKLLGKTLSEEGESSETSFAKRDLPQEHRVVKPGEMGTLDHKPERLNIHLAEDGTVRDVKYG